MTWRKSSYSPNEGRPTCVEVMHAETKVAIRDSKNPTQPPHHFTTDEWRAFIHGVKNGEFD
ncbi:DUF397 domain-containing protein [Pseudonocardia acaciae]|uniref:DUF397 domain-containing protein n=1 Tax=Pseudonocardia acaciae TaxID=551276 RepID=UPI00048DA2FA|nr:DUF397 domain-containing protein [Pseudonocardia acaciae]